MGCDQDSLELLGDGGRFRRLFQEMREGFALHEVIVDDAGTPVDYRFVEVNPAFELQTGLVAENVLGRTVLEVIPDIEPEWIFRYGYVALTGEPAAFVLPASALGRVYEVHAYSPQKGFFATLFMDVTERQQGIAALRESEERYRELYEQSPLGYQSLDEEGRVLTVNDAWTRALGYSSQEATGMWFGDFLVPDQVEAFRQRFPEFKAAGAVHTEFAMVRKDGEIRRVAFDGRIGRDARGGFKQTHCILQDVTDRRRIEEAQRQLDERHKSTFTDAPYPMIIHAEDGEVVQINKAWEELSGYGIDDIPTIDEWTQRVYGERRQVVEKDIEALFGIDGRKEGGEHTIRTAWGESRVWDFCSAPLGTMPDGRRLILSTARDVTDSIKGREALRLSHAQLQKMVFDVTEALGRIVEARDPYTQGHQERVAGVSRAIAIEMGLSDDEVAAIEMAALVHDIGKMAVPSEILSKPGKLSAAEFNLMKCHPQQSYDILKDVTFPFPIADIVLQHHERLDGSGYPGGLSGSNMQLAARVLAVGDVVEAMASHRPYRPALPMSLAISEISDTSKYDADVVDAFLRLYKSDRVDL